MIRLAKLTDYAIVVLAQMTRRAASGQASARVLAEEVGLAVPTVSKVLKTLARGQVLVAQRGKGGGYRLARPAGDISVADIIEAMEGPLALTDCSTDETNCCCISESCQVKTNWLNINRAIRTALAALTLEAMAKPLPQRFTPNLTLAAAGREESAFVTIGGVNS